MHTMAGFLRPFSQIALLVAQSHERSQFAIREGSSALEQSQSTSVRSGPCICNCPCDLRRRSRLRAQSARQRTHRARVPSIAACERCRSLDVIVGSDRADAAAPYCTEQRAGNPSPAVAPSCERRHPRWLAAQISSPGSPLRVGQSAPAPGSPVHPAADPMRRLEHAGRRARRILYPLHQRRSEEATTGLAPGSSSGLFCPPP